MDERKMLEKIRRQQRPVPEGFEQRMDARLDRIVQKKPAGKLTGAKPLRIAAALLVFIAAGAFALQQSGLLNFREPYIKEAYYFMLPEAENLVHHLNVSADFDGWKAELREVLYDGRWLKLLFCVTDQQAAEPFTQQQKDAIQNGELSALYSLYQKADAYPSVETSGSLLVNGKQVDIRGVAAGVGDAPGEYLLVADSELELSAQANPGFSCLRPEGETELTLPFTNSQGIQVAALTAHFQAGDAASRYALPLPEPVQMETGRMVFYDLFLSPVHVVLEYGIVFPATQPEREIKSLPKVQIVTADRKAAGDGKDGYSYVIVRPDGAKEIRYHLTDTPSKEIGPLFLLLPDGTMLPLKGK